MQSLGLRDRKLEIIQLQAIQSICSTSPSSLPTLSTLPALSLTCRQANTWLGALPDLPRLETFTILRDRCIFLAPFEKTTPCVAPRGSTLPQNLHLLYIHGVHLTVCCFDPRRLLPFGDALRAITDLPTEVPKLAYPSCHTIGPIDLIRDPFSTALAIETAVSGHWHKQHSFLPYVLCEERICPRGRPSPGCQSYLRAIVTCK